MSLEVIYVARHGFRSNWVVNPATGDYQAAIRTPTGNPADPALTAHGVQQARELAAHLLTVQPPVDVVYSSPYYRCLQTVEPFVKLRAAQLEGAAAREHQQREPRLRRREHEHRHRHKHEHAVQEETVQVRQVRQQVPIVPGTISTSTASTSTNTSTSTAQPPTPAASTASPAAAAAAVDVTTTSSSLATTTTPVSAHSSSTAITPFRVRGEAGIGEWYGSAPFEHPTSAPLCRLRELFPSVLDEAYSSVLAPARLGESIAQLHDRAAAAAAAIIDQCDREGRRAVLLCSHAATIIALGRALTGFMPVDIETEDFGAFTCGLSVYRRRRRGSQDWERGDRGSGDNSGSNTTIADSNDISISSNSSINKNNNSTCNTSTTCSASNSNSYGARGSRAEGGILGGRGGEDGPDIPGGDVTPPQVRDKYRRPDEEAGLRQDAKDAQDAKQRPSTGSSTRAALRPLAQSWRGGRGVRGGWDCVVNCDCSFLSGGEERGWRFSGDESFGQAINSSTSTQQDPSQADSGNLGVVLQGRSSKRARCSKGSGISRL